MQRFPGKTLCGKKSSGKNASGSGRRKWPYPLINQESQIDPWCIAILLKSIAIHLPFLWHTSAKVCPSSWQKVVYTPPICITIRLPFVSRYFCGSIRVRGRWNTPKGVFWKRGLFRKVHFLEILENLEILEILENPQAVESKGESGHFLEILENLEILEILLSPRLAVRWLVSFVWCAGVTSTLGRGFRSWSVTHAVRTVQPCMQGVLPKHFD